MARPKLTLQDVARAAVDKNGGKGGRGLQRVAEGMGLTLSFTTVDRILAGKYESRPQKQTIEALAALSGLPLETVYEAAGVPLPMAPLADQLPDGADQLTVDQRRVVLDVVRGFIRDNNRIAELEDDLDMAPLHPHEIERRAAQTDPKALDDDDLDDLWGKLVLTDLRGEERTRVHEFTRSLEHELRLRELARRGEWDPLEDGRHDLLRLVPADAAPAAGGSGVAGDAERDGVTSDAPPVRPWEKADFDLAAKQGVNRGRAARERQDHDAEAPDAPHDD